MQQTSIVNFVDPTAVDSIRDDFYESDYLTTLTVKSDLVKTGG